MTATRIAFASVLATVVAAMGASGSAAATGPDDAPGQRCKDGNYVVIEYEATYPGATGDQDGSYERAVPSTGGCVSTWAIGEGRLTTAAIAAQCRTGIEARFGPYPITLQFAETYVLKNRADCISVMLGVSSGEIDPGNAPLFPGGARP